MRTEFVQIRMRLDKKQKWLALAQKENKSMTQFVIDAVETYALGIDIKEIIEQALIK